MVRLIVPTGSNDGVAAVRIAMALDCYRRNVDQVADWAHSSWIAASFGVPETRMLGWRALLVGAPTGATERCSRALVRALSVPPPEFADLSQGGFKRTATVGLAQPNACLLDVVPAPVTLQIWRMRALLLRRGEVRRLIDRHAQRRLAEWTGLDVDVLMSGPNTDSANDVARLASVAIPPLATMDADTLAIEGMLLVLRDLKGPDGVPFPLSRLALARYVDAPAWLNALPTQHDEGGTARLFRRLPELLREWAWLFG
ncbi:type III secretion protein HrpB4 [Burkholderia alba]|uniref:type III secretion protein HrpB4 n=1 Tax=Burkholderia alba TaxID=2683677 RepID=UPI002B059E63|nr:type III secretion protein HrpB4 [Burkholderia alba]